MKKEYLAKYEKGGFVIQISTDDYMDNKFILSSLGGIWTTSLDGETKTTKLPFEAIVYINKKTNLHFSFEDFVVEALNQKSPEIRFVRKPFPHQVDALNYLYRWSSAPLLLSMGTGKTKIVLDLFKARKKSHQVNKLLVICPISCIQVWEDEAKQEKLTSINLRGKSSHEIDTFLEGDWDVYILNYDLLKRFFNIIKQKNGKESFFLRMPDYLRKNFMLVYDESTKIKDHKSKRTKYALKLAESIRFKNILTGTLIGNTLEDVWSQISVVSKVFYNNYTKLHSWWSWLNYFFYTNKYTHKSKPKSIIKEDYINYATTVKAFTFTIDELHLPPKIYNKRYVELSKEQQKHYMKVKNDLYTELEEGTLTVANVAIKLNKLEQITSGLLYLYDDSGNRKTHFFKNNPKLDELVDVLGELDKNKKYIIWHAFIEEGVMIQKKLESVGYKNVIFLRKGADFNQKEFNSYKGQLIVIANTRMIGYGNTLKGVEHVFYYSNDWSYLNREQSEARTQRIGIQNSCNYIDLIARINNKPIIDEYILSVIKHKRDLDNIVREYGLKRVLDVV